MIRFTKQTHLKTLIMRGVHKLLAITQIQCEIKVKQMFFQEQVVLEVIFTWCTQKAKAASELRVTPWKEVHKSMMDSRNIYRCVCYQSKHSDLSTPPFLTSHLVCKWMRDKRTCRTGEEESQKAGGWGNSWRKRTDYWKSVTHPPPWWATSRVKHVQNVSARHGRPEVEWTGTHF